MVWVDCQLGAVKNEQPYSDVLGIKIFSLTKGGVNFMAVGYYDENLRL